LTSTGLVNKKYRYSKGVFDKHAFKFKKQLSHNKVVQPLFRDKKFITQNGFSKKKHFVHNKPFIQQKFKRDFHAKSKFSSRLSKKHIVSHSKFGRSSRFGSGRFNKRHNKGFNKGFVGKGFNKGFNNRSRSLNRGFSRGFRSKGFRSKGFNRGFSRNARGFR